VRAGERAPTVLDFFGNLRGERERKRRRRRIFYTACDLLALSYVLYEGDFGRHLARSFLIQIVRTRESVRNTRPSEVGHGLLEEIQKNNIKKDDITDHSVGQVSTSF